MKITICGPNLMDQSKGTFHVHAADCADLVRGARREPEYANGWTIDADSRDEVGDEIYADHIAEGSMDPGDGKDDCHFFPCCDDLPVHENTIARDLMLEAMATEMRRQNPGTLVEIVIARKWTAEVSVAGQSYPVTYGSSDTLREVEKSAVSVAADLIRDGLGSDGSVVIYKQLKDDPEPVRDRSIYVYRDDHDGSIRTQR